MRGMPRARMASAVFLVVALVIVAGTAGVATGLPLPPLFPALPPVAGESHLTSYIVGPASSVSVDWMVLPAAFFGGGPYSSRIRRRACGSPRGIICLFLPGRERNGFGA